MARTKNCTTLRLLHYPGISEDLTIKPGQIRCGEHTDYGSITLLFQDDMPGLEVNIIKMFFSFCIIKGKTTESGLVTEECCVLMFSDASMGLTQNPEELLH